MKSLNIEFFKTETIADFLEIWLNNDFLPKEKQETFSLYYRSYKKRFDNYIKKNYNQQTKELMEIANRISNPNILEIGTGCGTETLWMALKGYNVLGIDIDDSLLAVAKKRQEILERYSGQKIPCQFIKKSIVDMDDKKNLI